MLNVILSWSTMALKAISENKSYRDIERMKIREAISRFKYVEEEKVENHYQTIMDEMILEFDSLEEM